MKKAFALFIVTILCAGALLPASVSGRKSSRQSAQQQSAPVQSGPEVQFGERAVSARVMGTLPGPERTSWLRGHPLALIVQPLLYDHSFS